MALGNRIFGWVWNNVVKKGDEKRIATLPPVDGVKGFRDIDYMGDGNEWHLMDIYRPEAEGDKKLPLIIDIHGGGWMYGDKNLNRNYCMSLSKRGFVVATMSYSLFPSVTLPRPVEEIFCAIDFICGHAADYGIDADNIFLTGDSAGGHYTGLVSSIIADPLLQELYGVSTAVRFNAIAFTCAAFYPNAIAKMPVSLAKTFVRNFYGGERDFKNHAMYKSVDICNNRVQDFPPMFINSCYNDMLKGDTVKFAALLDEKGIPYELDFPKKEDCKNKMGHVYSVLHPDDWEESVRTNDKLCEFFKKHMK